MLSETLLRALSVMFGGDKISPIEHDKGGARPITPKTNETPVTGDVERVMQSFADKTLVLKRGLLRNSSGQVGALYDGEDLVCHILEDPSRDVKIYGETAIPDGLYQVLMNTTQGRAAKNGSRWPWHKKEVFYIPDVVGFELIQIHTGNRPKDTLGCLLTGTWYGRRMEIGESVTTYKRFYERYSPIARAGHLWIRIEE